MDENCDFCGRSTAEVGRLFAPGVAAICRSCAREALGTLDGELALPGTTVLTRTVPVETIVTQTRSVTSSVTTSPVTPVESGWADGRHQARQERQSGQARGMSVTLPLNRTVLAAAAAAVALVVFMLGRRSRHR